jgi:hypothetical protein
MTAGRPDANSVDEELSPEARVLVDRVRQVLAAEFGDAHRGNERRAADQGPTDLGPTERQKQAILGRVLALGDEESTLNALESDSAAPARSGTKNAS